MLAAERVIGVVLGRIIASKYTKHTSYTVGMNEKPLYDKLYDTWNYTPIP